MKIFGEKIHAKNLFNKYTISMWTLAIWWTVSFTLVKTLGGESFFAWIYGVMAVVSFLVVLFLGWFGARIDRQQEEMDEMLRLLREASLKHYGPDKTVLSWPEEET